MTARVYCDEPGCRAVTPAVIDWSVASETTAAGIRGRGWLPPVGDARRLDYCPEHRHLRPGELAMT